MQKKKQQQQDSQSSGSKLHRYTLLFHVVFFAAMSAYEFLMPMDACVQGIVGPLSTTSPAEELCVQVVHENDAARFVFFGLRKYHALFMLISLWAVAVNGKPLFLLVFFAFCFSDLFSDLRVQEFVCLLHAANFGLDVSYAYMNLHLLRAGVMTLIPQTLLVAWNVFCGVRRRH